MPGILACFFFFFFFFPTTWRAPKELQLLSYEAILRLCSHYTGLLLRRHESHAGLLFTPDRNGCGGAISVTKRS